MEKRNPCRSTENATCKLTEYACFSWNSGVTGTGDEIESHLQVKNLILMLKRQTIELQIQNTVLKLQNKDSGIETSLLKMRIS